MTTVTGQVLAPDGTAPAAAVDRQVTITLVDQSGVSRPGYTSGGEVVAPLILTAARDGTWSANLTGNAAITCDWGTTLFRVEEGYSPDQRGHHLTFISVPTSGGPYAASSLRVTPPGGATLQSGYLPLSGGTLTGPLTLPSDPTLSLQAATKAYVDAHAGGGGGGAVSSVNGQTGAVTLTASNVGAIASGARNAANGVAGLDASSLLSAAQVPTLDASKIGTGTFATARIPDLSATYLAVTQRGAASGVASLDGSTLVPTAQIPTLDASKIGTGTLGTARIPDLSGTYLTVAQRNAANGVAGLDNSSLIASGQIPTLDASKIGSGTFATARIPDLSATYVPVSSTISANPAVPLLSHSRNFTIGTSSTNIAEFRVNGTLYSWLNEWGGYRAQPAYDWDAGIRLILRSTQTGNILEIQNSARTQAVFGVSASGGLVMGNGSGAAVVMAPVYTVPASASLPGDLPASLPSGTVVIQLSS